MGLWILIPQQLVVEFGLGVVYTVTGGQSLLQFYTLACAGHECVPVSKTQWIIVFSCLQLLISQVPPPAGPTVRPPQFWVSSHFVRLEAASQGHSPSPSLLFFYFLSAPQFQFHLGHLVCRSCHVNMVRPDRTPHLPRYNNIQTLEFKNLEISTSSPQTIFYFEISFI